METNTKKISVFDILRGPFAVSTEDGERLYAEIKEGFDKNQKVEVDFKNILLIVSTFLNAAIGQLYGVYEVERIRENLNITNMDQDDLRILKIVTDRAKEYFNDKDGLSDLFKKHFPDA